MHVQYRGFSICPGCSRTFWFVLVCTRFTLIVSIVFTRIFFFRLRFVPIIDAITTRVIAFVIVTIVIGIARIPSVMGTTVTFPLSVSNTRLCGGPGCGCPTVRRNLFATASRGVFPRCNAALRRTKSSIYANVLMKC